MSVTQVALVFESNARMSDGRETMLTRRAEGKGCGCDIVYAALCSIVFSVSLSLSSRDFRIQKDDAVLVCGKSSAVPRVRGKVERYIQEA